jgi:hypothetical protein
MGKTVEDVALLLGIEINLMIEWINLYFYLSFIETIQGVDRRDNATQQTGIIRYENYTQFLLGVEGLRHIRLGVVRQGKFFK